MRYRRFLYLISWSYRWVREVYYWVKHLPFYFKTGIPYRKAWAPNIHFAHDAIKRLEAFIAYEPHGYPMSFTSPKDHPEGVYTGDMSGKGYEGWIDTIAEIVFGFKLYLYLQGGITYEKSKKYKCMVKDVETKLHDMGVLTEVRIKHTRISDGVEVGIKEVWETDWEPSEDHEGCHEYKPKTKSISVLSDGSEIDSADFWQNHEKKMYDIMDERLSWYAKYFISFMD